MRSSPNLIYRLAHKDYPESLSAYSPKIEDYYEPISSLLPAGWNIQRHDIWFYCSPTSQIVPEQGWKIHVSAIPGNSRELLRRVASILFEYNNVSFKFAADCSLLSLLNSKTWPRGASGKFITIYPPDSSVFMELIEKLDEATRGMQGPYILSDHRYKDSRVIFYRYGSMRMQAQLNVKGEKVPVLMGPDGNLIPDQRLPYPVVLPWHPPVIPLVSQDQANSETFILHDRYTIVSAVSFSNAGGVYFAQDHKTGRKVVVKEARPCINATVDDYDAVELLKKEHRLLTVLADTCIAPDPIELFQEWEHWFLVEGFIEGTPMSRHAAGHNILLRTRATASDCDEWRAILGRLASDLIRIVEVLHSRGIVFADLSPNNLIVNSDGDLKIIDFEGAYQPGVDRPPNIFTPGFGSQHCVTGGEARWQDDYYSAGAVLLSCLLPVNGLLHLNPQARREFLTSISNDVQLPATLAGLINQLMDHPETASTALRGVESAQTSWPSKEHEITRKAPHDYQTVLDDIVSHVDNVAEYKRKDRLYPADPRIFSTNPLSLAYGAAGIAYALHKITGNIPRAAVEWILEHRITPAEYAPGLYLGMGGIAWSLLEMGFQKSAEKICQSAFEHPLTSQCSDLFYGRAGLGMTALRFFQTTQDEMYLEEAKQIGNALLSSGTQSVQGYFWSSTHERPLGLAHGSSGIALFLLYLHLATGDEHYLRTGMRALDFDLASATRTKDGGLSWRESMESPSPLYPYWRIGSAGIGIVVARFQRLVSLPRYQAALEQIYIDTDHKYSVLPGRFMGLAGLGEFLLDMHDLTGEQRFLTSAHRVAKGIMHFRVMRKGTAFPGEMLSRLCCDYGTGSAGIALFLNRLLGKQNADFMLDELFAGSSGKTAHTAWPAEEQVFKAAA